MTLCLLFASGTTIGAGSVVVKDIPDGCVAVGNPCRVVKMLEQSIRVIA
ncbi:MAG: hypothetical protein MR690_08300 [Rikenellaceae bacterium]|nr:hypothetical protein [Rikenellaceae bacterium]